MDKNLQQALIAHQKGKFKDAEQLYQSVLETNPKSLEANNNLGILLFGLGRLDESGKYFKKPLN